MKILGLIPARSGSKGIPNKNIKLLGNKPLLQYTSEIALQSKFLSKIVLSSDSEHIMQVGKNLGIEAPFKRPLDLAKDKSPTLPVILHVLEFFEKKGEYFDAVCLLQVTSPFRSIDFLDKAIKKFKKSKTDSLVSVLEVPHEYNPHWTYTLDINDNLQISTGESEIISRRQDLPKAFIRDGSIYITKTSVLKEQKSIYGKSIAYIVSSKENYVNIDTMDDWKKAEKMIEEI